MPFTPPDLSQALARVERRIGSAYYTAVRRVLDGFSVQDVRRMVEDHDLEPIVTAYEQESRGWSRELIAAGLLGGAVAARWAQRSDPGFDFNPVEPETADALNAIADRATEFVRAETAPLVQSAYFADSAETGARDFRDGLGLTERQAITVRNFRRRLMAESSEILDAQAVSDLNAKVERYANQMLRRSARMWANLQGLQALHEGMQAALEQAIAQGAISRESLRRVWITMEDDRVRPSHEAMHGQARRLGEPFESGAGNELAYPGDPDAPLSETANCRCILATEFAGAEEREFAGVPEGVTVEIQGGYQPAP